ncbi:nickel/cobalt transporter [Nonomuraea roseoviolacea]|uniref:ABC-type nickel/cobalt efflux system permease component RcnA n=1 Tax=Nonomuraea roseoviolacea subsp. carminata TaxID=160689 RepID=A0ABT1JU92_9ACTN|nr:High-affinity nickel-transporter [Nonomuraea roseoviolacea]MCP2345302.1 ABC-type nickel/cobalt efflux system permease component RcnA [Nonomuraea roseoviolacea subsp. carminata]
MTPANVPARPLHLTARLIAITAQPPLHFTARPFALTARLVTWRPAATAALPDPSHRQAIISCPAASRQNAGPAAPGASPQDAGPAHRSASRTGARLVPPALVAVVLGVLLLGPVLFSRPALAATAPAHPMGNFTVNHYNGLRLQPAQVRNLAVVDAAELPTLQAQPQVDASYADRRCAALAAAQRLTVGGTATPWRVERAEYVYRPGQGGLRTSRLTCELTAPAAASPGGRGTVVTFADAFEQERIGWREITAVGDGVRLAASSAPAVSVSDELRTYPQDLLADPLDQRTATVTVAGAGPPSAAGTGAGTSGTTPLGGIAIGGPVGDALAALDRTFTGLVGADRLTAPLGLLALGLAVVLGAGHALIPGHGKTIMAAYLAGRRGRPRDALVVGATVTATHTAGVLVVGLLLSAFTALAGESVLAWLGVASGVLIAVMGGRLLLASRRDHDSGHGHGHVHGDRHEHAHGYGHGHGHGHGHAGGGVGRGGLLGMGIAGGLVPSPSALIVLLGAIGLGRAWFGVALVTAYGLGMAATLTATGLLLVKLVGRLERRASAGQRLAARLSGLAPAGTAVMVVLLGAGLALRSVTAL